VRHHLQENSRKGGAGPRIQRERIKKMTEKDLPPRWGAIKYAIKRNVVLLLPRKGTLNLNEVTTLIWETEKGRSVLK